MHSTKHNLVNPTSIDTLDVPPKLSKAQWVESKLAMNIERVTQDFYDRIAIPDPHTCYVIIGAVDNRMYYGSHLIIPVRNKVSYLIGQDPNVPNEWILYMNERENFVDRLSEVCTYDDPQKALDFLRICNMVGSHYTVNITVYNILVSYINEEININDTIISLLASFGYKESPRLQDIIQTIAAHGSREGYYRELRIGIIGNIETIASYSDNPLYGYYLKLYDIFKKRDFFRQESEVQDKNTINLQPPVQNIIDVMLGHIPDPRA